MSPSQHVTLAVDLALGEGEVVGVGLQGAPLNVSGLFWPSSRVRAPVALSLDRRAGGMRPSGYGNRMPQSNPAAMSEPDPEWAVRAEQCLEQVRAAIMVLTEPMRRSSITSGPPQCPGSRRSRSSTSRSVSCRFRVMPTSCPVLHRSALSKLGERDRTPQALIATFRAETRTFRMMFGRNGLHAGQVGLLR
jgi:hypothetical protein